VPACTRVIDAATVRRLAVVWAVSKDLGQVLGVDQAATEVLHLPLPPYVDPGTAPVAVAAYHPVPLATMVAAYTVAALRPPRVGWTAGIPARRLRLQQRADRLPCVLTYDQLYDLCWLCAGLPSETRSETQMMAAELVLVLGLTGCLGESRPAFKSGIS